MTDEKLWEASRLHIENVDEVDNEAMVAWMMLRLSLVNNENSYLECVRLWKDQVGLREILETEKVDARMDALREKYETFHNALERYKILVEEKKDNEMDLKNMMKMASQYNPIPKLSRYVKHRMGHKDITLTDLELEEGDLVYSQMDSELNSEFLRQHSSTEKHDNYATPFLVKYRSYHIMKLFESYVQRYADRHKTFPDAHLFDAAAECISQSGSMSANEVNRYLSGLNVNKDVVEQICRAVTTMKQCNHSPSDKTYGLLMKSIQSNDLANTLEGILNQTLSISQQNIEDAFESLLSARPYKYRNHQRNMDTYYRIKQCAEVIEKKDAVSLARAQCKASICSGSVREVSDQLKKVYGFYVAKSLPQTDLVNLSRIAIGVLPEAMLQTHPSEWGELLDELFDAISNCDAFPSYMIFREVLHQCVVCTELLSRRERDNLFHDILMFSCGIYNAISPPPKVDFFQDHQDEIGNVTHKIVKAGWAKRTPHRFRRQNLFYLENIAAKVYNFDLLVALKGSRKEHGIPLANGDFRKIVSMLALNGEIEKAVSFMQETSKSRSNIDPRMAHSVLAASVRNELNSYDENNPHFTGKDSLYDVVSRMQKLSSAFDIKFLDGTIDLVLTRCCERKNEFEFNRACQIITQSNPSSMVKLRIERLRNDYFS